MGEGKCLRGVAIHVVDEDNGDHGIRNRESPKLLDAQRPIGRLSHDPIAHDEYAAGSVSNLDLLTTEQSLVALDASVASSDASLIQLQIDVFKALGGGWRNEDLKSP